MKNKLFFLCTFLLLTQLSFACFADYESTQKLQYVEENGLTYPYSELQKQDDVFDASAEVKPLATELSQKEQLQENSSDLDYIEEQTELPDLPCNSPNLKKQIAAFIYNNLKQQTTFSVIELRKRNLMVKNLSEFQDVSADKIDSSKYFVAAATDAYLRINQHREIKHICKSFNKDASKRFNDIYVIVYPFLNFYKVVVTNLMNSTDDLEKATFIYNW